MTGLPRRIIGARCSIARSPANWSPHSAAGGRGFGTPSILDYLPLRKFDPADARHSDLVALSRRLHEKTVVPTPPAGELEAIDRLAAGLLHRFG